MCYLSSNLMLSPCNIIFAYAQKLSAPHQKLTPVVGLHFLFYFFLYPSLYLRTQITLYHAYLTTSYVMYI